MFQKFLFVTSFLASQSYLFVIGLFTGIASGLAIRFEKYGDLAISSDNKVMAKKIEGMKKSHSFRESELREKLATLEHESEWKIKRLEEQINVMQQSLQLQAEVIARDRERVRAETKENIRRGVAAED